MLISLPSLVLSESSPEGFLSQNMQELIDRLAHAALDIEAVKFQPSEPFCWASGYFMPIYNDNRRLLARAENRELVRDGFIALIEQHNLEFDLVAGTATAGISPGTTLADKLRAPFIYVRDKAKGHGLRNQIEGVLNPKEQVLVIEDVISTGGSSVRAVEAVRAAEGIVECCLGIFSYGFDAAQQQFEEANCKCHTILDYETLLRVAVERNYLSESAVDDLRAWRQDPFGWGEQRGFPPKEK